MGNVIRLSDNGIDPSLATASDELKDGIWLAIDRAAEHNMPIGLIIGQLEMIKAAMIEAHFRKGRGE